MYCMGFGCMRYQIIGGVGIERRVTCRDFQKCDDEEVENSCKGVCLNRDNVLVRDRYIAAKLKNIFDDVDTVYKEVCGCKPLL